MPFIFLFGLSPDGAGQHHSLFFNLKSTIKRAERHYKKISYVHAIQLYQRALGKDSSNNGIKLKIADCYRLINHSKEAEQWYNQVINDEQIITPTDKLHYAQILLANSKYEESKKWFILYNKDTESDSIGLRKIKGIDNLKTFFEDSLNYPVQKVQINTHHADFSPHYYAEGIVFVSSRNEGSLINRKSAADHSSFFDLYYSKFNDDGSLSKPIRFNKKINNKLHEGPVAFYDNENKMIFTRNSFTKIKSHSSDEVNRLMLFSARKKDPGEWTTIKSLPFNSPDYSTGHPAISTNGKTLYFISDMPGGFGGTDIYISTYKDSSWSFPTNAGPEINTSGNELFPYLHGDTLLYFSSNGYSGLGGLDIYRAEIRDGDFYNLKNIGYPINSTQDDFGIVFSRDGKSGFFSSNRNTGTNDDDIFSFEVVKILVDGTAIAKLKNTPLCKVTLKVYQNKKEETVIVNNNDGKFYLNLDPGKEYLIIASANNYRTIKKKISTKEYSKHEPILLTLAFEKINKAYVKGVVRSDSTFIPNTIVFYQEGGSGKIDTTRTDEHGEFHCEVDAEMENIFFTEHNGKFGMVSLKHTKKKKGSVLFYVNLELQAYTVQSIQGIVKNKTLSAEGITVIIKNEMTGSADSLCTNKSGAFTFNAASYTNYTIEVLWGEKKAVLKGFNIKRIREPVLEIFIAD